MNSTDNLNSSIDSQSRLPEILGILITFASLSTISVIMRAYTRIKLLHIFRIDDGMMVGAQVLTIGTAIAIGLEGKYGLGQHIWTIPASSGVPYLKAFYVSVITYTSAVTVVKLSILLQIRRIFAMPKIKIATTIGLIFITCWSITIFFLWIFVCNPVPTFWDHNPNGTCLNFLTLWYINASINIVTDFAIFTLPLPVISTLNLKIRQKIILFFIFSLGFFTCGISLYRIRTLHVAASTTDPTWDNVDAATWSFMELSIAIVAACLSTLRPLVIKVVPHFFSSMKSTNTGNSTGNLDTTNETSKYKSYNESDTIMQGGSPTDEVHLHFSNLRNPRTISYVIDPLQVGRPEVSEV